MPRNSDSPRQRVVLVEDNEDLRRGLAEYLSLCNFIVDEAATGAAFFAALQQNRYDVVILDVNLPDVSGFDLARFMAAKGDAGIIVLTARGGRQDRVRGYETGADLYLTKPVDSEELALAAWNLGLRVRRTRAATVEAPDPSEAESAAVTAPMPDTGPEPDLSAPKPGLWSLDRARQALHCPNGATLVVSGKESLLLEQMAGHVGKIISRNSLQSIYEDDVVPLESRKLDVAISRLRIKIRSVGMELPVQIIRGGGIRLLEPIAIT